MKTYVLDYYETYHEIYSVEAETADDAKQKLLDALMEGHESGPDCCSDSGFIDVREANTSKQ